MTGRTDEGDYLVSLYLGRLRGLFGRPIQRELRIPEEPACELPASPSEAFAEGWRKGWLAGKFDTQ